VPIVKVGDAAPVGTFTRLGAPSIAETQVAFFANFVDSAHGGIFIGDGGPLTAVIAEGDSLFGSTVVSLTLGTSGLDDAANSVTFGYTLANGVSGIAIASVPEPPTLLLLALGGLAVIVSCSFRIA